MSATACASSRALTRAKFARVGQISSKIRNANFESEFQNSKIQNFEILMNWSRIGATIVLNSASFVQLSNFSKFEKFNLNFENSKLNTVRGLTLPI